VGNTGIIDFPTSPKSNFWLCRSQKMNKNAQATTWNVSSLTSRKSFSWLWIWFTTNRRLNIAYSTSNKLLFQLDRNTENGFSRPVVYVKFRFLDIAQVADSVGTKWVCKVRRNPDKSFSRAQEKFIFIRRGERKLHCREWDHPNHRVPNIAKDAYLAVKNWLFRPSPNDFAR
jgi:hypothetical protein